MSDLAARLRAASEWGDKSWTESEVARLLRQAADAIDALRAETMEEAARICDAGVAEQDTNLKIEPTNSAMYHIRIGHVRDAAAIRAKGNQSKAAPQCVHRTGCVTPALCKLEQRCTTYSAAPSSGHGSETPEIPKHYAISATAAYVVTRHWDEIASMDAAKGICIRAINEWESRIERAATPAPARETVAVPRESLRRAELMLEVAAVTGIEANGEVSKTPNAQICKQLSDEFGKLLSAVREETKK